jgi:hypothetical protein
MPEEIGPARKGRCLCGAVRFTARGEPRWVAHCHCDSCRRATSAPVVTYAGFMADQVEWKAEKPALFHSSQGVERGFCARCGSPISFTGEKWPDEVHLFVASFEEPNNFAPTSHVHVAEKLAWLHLGDGLPRYATTPREGPPIT